MKVSKLGLVTAVLAVVMLAGCVVVPAHGYGWGYGHGYGWRR